MRSSTNRLPCMTGNPSGYASHQSRGQLPRRLYSAGHDRNTELPSDARSTGHRTGRGRSPAASHDAAHDSRPRRALGPPRSFRRSRSTRAGSTVRMSIRTVIARERYEFLHLSFRDDAIHRPGSEIAVEFGRASPGCLDALQCGGEPCGRGPARDLGARRGSVCQRDRPGGRPWRALDRWAHRRTARCSCRSWSGAPSSSAGQLAGRSARTSCAAKNAPSRPASQCRNSGVVGGL